VITHHRGSDGRLATASRLGLPAQIHVAPTSMPPATSTVFSGTTHRWGGLKLHNAGESTLVDELRARESG
jgi:hypothetical protein